ncbi:MAG: DUF488 domain-containing protein [Chitinophagales bacterium]|nr:DUF488 domain-containing protein [Chitinophagales bacterium]
MEVCNDRKIFTIGHSTRSIDELIELLETYQIQLLADIRHYPGSRKNPQFSKENLNKILPLHQIEYIHLLDLGGRRPVQKDSINDLWRNDSFRGYADYMETEQFEKAVQNLQGLASQKTTCYMCSEAVWWRCHRSMVSDYLKAKGWTVMHILSKTKCEEHPYTSPARIVGDKVYYHEKNLFD